MSQGAPLMKPFVNAVLVMSPNDSDVTHWQILPDGYRYRSRSASFRGTAAREVYQRFRPMRNTRCFKYSNISIPENIDAIFVRPADQTCQVLVNWGDGKDESLVRM